MSSKIKILAASWLLLAIAGCDSSSSSHQFEKDFDISQFANSNLPLVVVEKSVKSIPDEPKVLVKMKLIDSDASNILDDVNNLDYGFDEEHRYAGIERRGFSSQGFAKKQYGVELWQSDEAELGGYPLGSSEDRLDEDKAVDDQATPLLLMPKEEDWVLSAPFSDKTLMRNYIAYGLAADISGLWHPRTSFVELFFKVGDNVDYRGVYLLTEKIKRDKGRLDINKLKEDEVDGDDLTGGYLVELTSSRRVKDHEKTIRVGKKTLVVAYPKAKNLQSEQQSYIEEYFNQFIDALYGDNPDDPENGYATLADVDSFIDYLLINELFKNLDAFLFSTYFHKDKDGLLVAGPVWDFNISSGNNATSTARKQDHSPEGWMYTNHWIAERLYQSPKFVTEFRARWKNLRAGMLSDAAMEERIDSAFEELNQGAAARNFQKWDVLGHRVVGNQIPKSQSHLEEVRYFKQWMLQRLLWIDNHIDSL
ncbi:Uncharacterised protein [BD1-7 clade bacterium]|nr:Uncharacterised protein [BD1-7 clade bacterium]